MELKRINIKGKDYVQVDVRLAEFRRLYPTWSIETEIVYFTDTEVTTRTSIKDETGRVIGTGLAHEEKASSQINRTSMYENAETSSVGRAIAIATNIGNIGSICSADEVDLAIKMQDAKPVQKDFNISVNQTQQEEPDLETALNQKTSKGTRYEDLDMDKLQFIIENAKSDYSKKCAKVVLEFKKEELEELANKCEDLTQLDEECPF